MTQPNHQYLEPLPEPETFPSVIDSTMLSAYRQCARKFWWEFIRRKRLKGGPGIHLTAGGAFAAAVAEARIQYHDRHADPESAVALGLGELWALYGDPTVPESCAKTWDRLASAYEAYFDHHPLESDLRPVLLAGKSAVECTFSIPLEGTSHPVTGDPLILAGRYDMLGLMDNGTLWCVDEKTTSRMGKGWSEQWDLRGQFTCYQWAARQHGFPVAGLLVRGVCILKHEIKLAEKYVYWSEWKEQRWLEQTLRTIHDMKQSWKSGWWNYSLGDACNAYGRCPMRTLCESPKPDNWMQYYETNDWDPLRITVEEENGV